jgi:hypothetical protein
MKIAKSFVYSQLIIWFFWALTLVVAWRFVYIASHSKRATLVAIPASVNFGSVDETKKPLVYTVYLHNYYNKNIAIRGVEVGRKEGGLTADLYSGPLTELALGSASQKC